MKVTIVLSRDEEFDGYFRRLGSFEYTITSRRRGSRSQPIVGRIVVSPNDPPSPDRVIQVRDDGLEAPNPMVVRPRSHVTWINLQPRQIRIVLEPHSTTS